MALVTLSTSDVFVDSTNTPIANGVLVVALFAPSNPRVKFTQGYSAQRFVAFTLNGSGSLTGTPQIYGSDQLEDCEVYFWEVFRDTTFLSPIAAIGPLTGQVLNTTDSQPVSLLTHPAAGGQPVVSSSGFPIGISGTTILPVAPNVLEAANTVLAGPTSGIPAPATFRSLVTADLPSSASLKPVSADAIQYVTTEGNDANDGLSWGSAKLTVAAAQTAIGASGVVFTAAGFNSGFGIHSAGVFTDTQMNEVSTVSVNNTNFQTELNRVGGTHNGDAFAAGLTVPSTSTIFQADVIAAYGNNSSPNTNAVGIYSQMVALANNTTNWGANIVVSDAGLTTGLSQLGIELDVGQQSPSTAYTGLYGYTATLAGGGTGTVGGSTAFFASGNEGQGDHYWDFGFATANGWVNTAALSIGAVGVSGTTASQKIAFTSLSSGTPIISYISSDSSGNLFINSAVGLLVNNSAFVENMSTQVFPTLGTGSGAFRLLASTAPGNGFGLFAGNLSSGGIWLQQMRDDGTGTAYPIILNPSGAGIEIGQPTGGDTGTGSLNVAVGYYANGTAGVTQTAEAVGTMATIGGIVTTFTAVSDERLKNFTSYKGGLDEIMNISPIRYRWNEEGQRLSGQKGDRDYIGFSAQNAQSVIPESIQNTTKEGYLSFDDRPIIAALVNAVKTQQKQIEQLVMEITALKG